jgi:acetone carboxylase gamma subunit
MLKDLCKFILGLKNLDETKLDYSIKRVLGMSIDDKYYAFDVSTKQSVNLSDKILSKFHEKFMVIQNIMKKFKYADDGNEMKESINFNEINTNLNSITKNELITDYKNVNWINEFNNENFIKSVELQETIANSVLTSNYFTLRLS